VYIIIKDGNSYPLQNDKLEQGATELTVYDYQIVLNNALYGASIPNTKLKRRFLARKILWL
jgi:hypothetical protein